MILPKVFGWSVTTPFFPMAARRNFPKFSNKQTISIQSLFLGLSLCRILARSTGFLYHGADFGCSGKCLLLAVV
jgi:hypothetical protein